MELSALIKNKIEEYDTIIIHRHVSPDGDAIGSTLGLREILRDNYPNKHIYSAGDDIPEYLQFVGEEDEVSDDKYNGALVISVDTADKRRIANSNFEKAKEIIKIDHHIPVEDFGCINYVKETYGSCSLVIYELAKLCNYSISKTAARYLYIAVVTDTGRFRYSEVDGYCLQLSGELLDFGVDTDDIYAHLYTKEKEVYSLTAYVYSHIKYTPSGVAYFYMSRRIMKKFNVSLEDASNCVNLMDSIKGTLIWALFIEREDKIRIRFRSRFVTVSEIANRYEGGGHANAAGGTIYNKKDIKKVLKDLDDRHATFKNENGDKF